MNIAEVKNFSSSIFHLGGYEMVENKQQSLKNSPAHEKPVTLKPIEELKRFDFATSDAFICDIETGICGPAKRDKETK